MASQPGLGVHDPGAGLFLGSGSLACARFCTVSRLHVEKLHERPTHPMRLGGYHGGGLWVIPGDGENDPTEATEPMRGPMTHDDAAAGLCMMWAPLKTFRSV